MVAAWGNVGFVETELEDRCSDLDVISVSESMLGDLQSVDNRSVMTGEIAHEISIVLQRDDAVSTREGSIGNANAIGGIATEREFGVERDRSASERTGDAIERSGHLSELLRRNLAPRKAK